MEPTDNLTFSADAYRIFIADRIVLTGNFVGDSVRLLLARNGFDGVGGARFFANAVDTRTSGLDVVANYTFTLLRASTVRLIAGFNITSTRVLHVADTPS